MSCKGYRRPTPDKWIVLHEQLAAIIKDIGIDEQLKIPNFVLANYLVDCVSAFSHSVSRRDKEIRKAILAERCDGDCDGTGVVRDGDDYSICPDCHGTAKKQPPKQGEKED